MNEAKKQHIKFSKVLNKANKDDVILWNESTGEIRNLGNQKNLKIFLNRSWIGDLK